MAEKISVGKFINNMDKEDLTSTDLQGVVGNVYAKAIADHKKTTKIADDNLKDKDKETVEFTKSNHDRLKANKDKVAKEVNKDDAKEVKPEGKVAKDVEETKGSVVVESVDSEIAKLEQKKHSIANRLDAMVAKNPDAEHTRKFKQLESEMESLASEIEELKSKSVLESRQVNETADEFEVVKYKGNQYGIWAKTSKNWMMFGKKADLEKRVKELNAGHKDYKKIDEALLEPGNIYSVLVKELPAEDIDHHDSDLYVRKTPKSTEIINRLTTKSLLSTFKDNIDGDIWYELPFCFSPHFQKEGLRKSGKKLNEEKEEYSFEEIIDMMASAEEYEDLYYAASLIKNDDLRIDVEELIDSCEQDEDDVDTAYSIVTSDLLDNKVNELNVKFLSSDHLNLDDLRAQGGVERVGEEAWKAACSGDTEWIEKIFNDGHLKPNEFRYNKFGAKHSLIMGALRNQQFETAEALKSLGEKILRSEVDEYKSIMAKKTYTDETSEGALDESKKVNEASYRGLAYYEYKGCHVRETPSCFVATNEHGTTIGQSQTRYGAEGIIDDYVNKKETKKVESKKVNEDVESNLFQPSVDPWERHLMDTSAWIKGTIVKDGAEYQVSAKVFNEPSQYGINHGRISKLWVKERGWPVAINYDRGWVDDEPYNDDLLNIVMKELEAYRDKHPISVKESMNKSKKVTESKTPYGGTTIEDYVNVNFNGSQENKDKLIAKMREKVDGSNYFNGLNMSVKDWKKAGEEFGLTMKSYPVTESKKLEESAKSWVLFFDKDGQHRAGSDWSTPMSVKAPLAKQRTLNHKIVWPNEAEGFIVLTPDHFSGISYDELQKLYNKGGISTGKLDRSIPFTESKELKEDWTVFEFTSGSNPYIAKTDKEVKRLLRKYKGRVEWDEYNGNYIVDDKERHGWDKPMYDPDPLPFDMKGYGEALSEETKGKKVYVVIEISRDSDVPKLIGVYSNKSDAEKDAYSEGRRWCNVIETTLKGSLKDESLKEARYNDGVAKGQHIASVDLFSTGVSDEDKKKAKELGHYEIDLDNKVFTRVKGNHWLGHWRIESYPRDTWKEVEKTARNIMKDGNFKEVSNDKYIEIQKDWENKKH